MGLDASVRQLKEGRGSSQIRMQRFSPSISQLLLQRVQPKGWYNLPVVVKMVQVYRWLQLRPVELRVGRRSIPQSGIVWYGQVRRAIVLPVERQDGLFFLPMQRMILRRRE